MLFPEPVASTTGVPETNAGIAGETVRACAPTPTVKPVDEYENNPADPPSATTPGPRNTGTCPGIVLPDCWMPLVMPYPRRLANRTQSTKRLYSAHDTNGRVLVDAGNCANK